MDQEIRLLCGVPGSGKSYYAAQLVKSEPKFVKVSRDEFRHMFRNEWYPGEEIEALVSSAHDAAIKSALRQGYSVVVDNTHCNLKGLKQTIRQYGKDARIVLKFIGSELSIKQIKEQNLQRDKVVPGAVIDKMHKGFTAVVKAKKELSDLINEVAGQIQTQITFKQNDKLPKCILVDIDGTIAHMGDGRGPFEWHKVDQDAPDEQVLNIIRALSRAGYNIIFMSGRDESCRALTEEWLITYYACNAVGLYMRPENNYQKDNIVKRDLFDKYIKDKYYVEAVFDDRDQVVQMWREELGLKCLQVAYGNF